MRKLHLIMPMGGSGSRFFKNGYIVPKPLIEINGKPFLYWSTVSITNYVEDCDVTFVVLEKHIAEFSIDQAIKGYFPNAMIVAVAEEEVSSGPVMTCLAGIRNIEDSVPILFNDCDHMFCCNSFNQAVSDGTVKADGALLTFESDEPQFSYVKFDDKKNVCGTVEKKVVSRQAICGAYYVCNAETFRAASAQYFKECEYSEYFVSGVYNVMCRNGLSVRSFEVDFHVPFGTPTEYESAKISKWFKRMATK